MSESENADVVEEIKVENNPRKRIRHRKKQIYENIMKQMEFYFSDANLSKDRFLGGLVKNDPYVPISEFLKFNKIRSMTQDASDIVKAMKLSTFLDLSEDKLKVCRKVPMMPYDADLRTVYVESIPVTANREWLDRVFSDYGQVAYISLPKFRNSQNKGFAFIEFASAQDAHNCVNTFTKMGCKLPSCMPPEELSSIKMFSVESVEELSDNNEAKDYEPPKKKTKKTKEKKPKTLELKQDESDSEKRLDTPNEESKEIISTPEESKNTDSETKNEMTSHDEMNTEEAPRKKKVKKRSSKEKGKVKALGKCEAPKGALWGLQVLPKLEWKALRNKYLNLQRKYMKEVKCNWNNKNSYSGIPAAVTLSVEGSVNNPREIESEKNLTPLEKIPGVFVKEELSEPCLDVRLTKRTIKTNIRVLHVEAKEGRSDVIVRFDSAGAADEYCAHNVRARVLRGADERSQWELAAAARACRRMRGRERARARAAASSAAPPAAPPASPPAAPPAAPASPQPTHTHIRFDE